MIRTAFRKTLILGGSVLLTGALAAGLHSGFAPHNMIETPAFAAEQALLLPAPKIDASESGKRAVAIFAGGCFWGVEGVFAHTKGVVTVASGYHGGSKADADYKKVSAGRTDHAEAVRVVYNPQLVSYGELMRIFFSVIADPTTLNRQGPDIGRHYRSALVPLNAQQGKAAKAYIAQLDKGGYFGRKIVTAIEAPKTFYRAETYHQDFMIKNPRHGYILRWDKPKVAALKRIYPAHYRAKPVS